MKKYSLLLAAGMVAVLSTGVMAQSIVWFDIRDGSAGLQSIATPTVPFVSGQFIGDPLVAGTAGDGQILRLNPKVSAPGNPGDLYEQRNAYPNFDGDADLSTGDLMLWMTVNDDLSGGGDDISSLGIDAVVVDAGAGGANRILSTSFELFATGAGPPPFAWSGVSPMPATGGDAPVTLAQKAVHIPVNAIPMYDTTGGLVPTFDYLVGKLSVVADLRTPVSGTHAADSTFEVNVEVNALLVTRVYNPLTPGDAEELVAFGYLGTSAGGPEADVSGNSIGAGSMGAPDALIIIQQKHDSDGNGRVTGLDAPAFTVAFTAPLYVAPSPHAGLTTLTQHQVYLYNNNGGSAAAVRVTGLDGPGFTAALGLPAP